MKNRIIILGLAVTLCAAQGCGSSGSSNEKPVANAGATQDVNASATVALDGSGSTDPNGDALTYAWTQTSGTTVTLSDATAVQPTFTAGATPQTYVFELVVSDASLSSDPATVTIRVWMDAAARIFVNASSASTADGTMANPYTTITSGINASTGGADVYVAKGTYSENITMAEGVGLFGGYEATNWTRDVSATSANTTTISPSTANVATITAGAGVTSATYLNGFAFTGPTFTESPGDVPFASIGITGSAAAPTISQNAISTGSNSASATEIGAISCKSGGGPVISDNTIYAYSSTSTTNEVFGIQISNCMGATISGNTISGSSDPSYSAAGGTRMIFVQYTSSALIDQNIISAGKNAGGITEGISVIDTSSATITRNSINGGDGITSSVTTGSTGIAYTGTTEKGIIENNIIYAGNGYSTNSSVFISDANSVSIHETANANIVNNTIYLGGDTTQSHLRGGIVNITQGTLKAVNNIIIQDSDVAATIQSCTVRTNVPALSLPSSAFDSVLNNDCYPVSGGYVYYYTDGSIPPNTSTTAAAMQTRLAAEGTAYATGNLNDDPLFQSGSDYLLSASSPLIGAGYSTSSGGVVTLPTDDYDGNARPTNNTWDIGADQYYAP